jgi:hypothetical protein
MADAPADVKPETAGGSGAGGAGGDDAFLTIKVQTQVCAGVAYLRV